MLAVLLVLVNAAMLVQCQICDSDHTIPLSEEVYSFDADQETRFSFTCPSGFLRRDSQCILSRPTWASEERCPDLESLNLEYNINVCYEFERSINKTSQSSRILGLTAPSSRQECSYPVSHFLVTSTEKNEINLTLSFDSETKGLYLDVYVQKQLLNLQQKVHCWGATNYDWVQSINFETYLPIDIERLSSTRYILETSQNITTYYCTFFNPGKQKPIISNKMDISRLPQNHYIFIVPNAIFAYDGMCYVADVSFVCDDLDDTRNVIYLPLSEFKDVSHAAKYLQNISRMTRIEMSQHENVSTETYIISNQYCLDHNDTISGVAWCATKIGDTTTPCGIPCVDSKGIIITRSCGGDSQTGAVWDQPSANCSTNNVESEATRFLLNERNAFVTANLLMNISSIIQDTSDISPIDLDSISVILANAASQDNAENLQYQFFDATDNMLNIDEEVFSKAYQSREYILNTIDKYLNKTAAVMTNLSYKNLAIKVETLNSALQLLTVERISVKLPNNMIEQSHDKGSITAAMAVFKNRKLFYEGALASDIADVVIPSAGKYFTEPISIYFDRTSNNDEVVCAYWNYGKHAQGNWSMVGVKTLRHNDSNTVECQAYHLTSFVLLGVSEKIIKDLNVPILKYISSIGCFLSLLGTIMTLVTAFTIRNWYKRRINTLQLSAVVFLEVLFLFAADISEPIGTSCIAIGAILHYLVLAKFMLMLIIAKLQYTNFVAVLTSRNSPQYNVTYSAISILGPLILVTIAASIFPHKYNSGNLNFCYPKDEIFIYFLIVPISIILLTNTVVFSLVMMKISKSITRGTKERNLQAKLALMLWFMLGLTWCSGLLAEVVRIRWLQIAFVYGFCILGPLQGFVVFWFAVVKDKYAMIFWRHKIERKTYDDISTTLQTLPLSSTVTKHID